LSKCPKGCRIILVGIALVDYKLWQRTGNLSDQGTAAVHLHQSK